MNISGAIRKYGLLKECSRGYFVPVFINVIDMLNL